MLLVISSHAPRTALPATLQDLCPENGILLNELQQKTNQKPSEISAVSNPSSLLIPQLRKKYVKSCQEVA